MANNEVLFLSERLPSEFPENWYEIASDDHFWIEWRLAAFLNQLQDLGLSVDKAWKGLDIGCGNGVVCGQLERRTAWTVDGADLNEQALALHPQRKGRSLYYNIHDRRPEMAKAYDFIVLFDVIEHIEDTERFLASARYHLKPGGWMFINVPAFNSLKSVYDTAAGHLRRYDRDMLREDMSRQKMELRDVRHWGLTMIPLLLLRSLTLTGASPAEIIRKGFAPPSPLLNTLLKVVMRLELALLGRPPLGTSLLAAAVEAP